MEYSQVQKKDVKGMWKGKEGDGEVMEVEERESKNVQSIKINEVG